MIALWLENLKNRVKRPSFADACIFFACIFGLAIRSVSFILPHDEGDELIYQTLVDQLLLGRGYTLRGSAFLASGFLELSHYDQPVFFHPPFGILFFLISKFLFGQYGIIIAQLLCYLIFVAGIILIAQSVFGKLGRHQWIVLSILIPLEPIFAHTGIKIWIDNPRLAFLTFGFGAFLRGGLAPCAWLRTLGAWSLGGAILTKFDTVLSLPFILLIDYCINAKPTGVLTFLKNNLVSLFRIFTPSICWLILVFVLTGSFLPGNPGRPSVELLNSNSYVRFVTLETPVYFYFRDFALVLSSGIGALILTVFAWNKLDKKLQQCALILWAGIIFQLVFFTVLGAMGYSKVLRYVCQIVPLMIIGAVLPLKASILADRNKTVEKVLAYSVYGLFVVLLLRESMFGLKVVLFNPRAALIPYQLFW
jgi:hypothetical protein